MHLSRNTVSYLAFRFFQDFALIYPVYVILFRSRGLSFTEIAALMAIWTGSVLVLELPSGVLADLWSRRGSVLLAMVLKAAGFLIWLIRPDFVGFALGFILWGVMEAFCSGTTDALLYDSLKAEGDEEAYEAVAGAGMLASRVAIAIAMMLGGFLFDRSPGTVLVVSSAAMLVSGLCVLAMTERPEFYRTIEPGSSRSGLHSLGDLVRTTKEALSGRGMVPLIVFGSIAGASYGMVEEYDTLFGTHLGVPVAFIGLWGALRFGLEGIGGAAAPVLVRFLKLRRPRRLALWTLLAGISLIAGTSSAAPRMLPFYFLFYLMIAPSEVIYQGILQRRIASSGRATFSSLASLLYTGYALVLGLLLGVVAERWGLPSLFQVGAVLIVVVSLVYRAFSR